MTTDVTPQTESRFLVDPAQTYTDPKLAAISELDQRIHEHPDAALEVVSSYGQSTRFEPSTPHHRIAAALYSALDLTRQGVTIFNCADPDTYDRITADDRFIALLQERRNEIHQADTLARQAALRGLTLYIHGVRQSILQ